MKKTTGKIINRLSLHRNQRWPRKIRCEMQLEWLEKWNNSLTIHFKLQKQPSRAVLRKRCSENMQQIYRRTPCRSAISIKLLYNFIEIGLQNGCSPVNLLHIFRISFPRNTFRRLLLKLETAYNFFVSWRNFHWREMHSSIEVEITLLQTPTTVQTNMKFRIAYCVLKIQCVLLQYNIPDRLSSLLHKDTTIYKSNAGEMRFQWASQPVTLIPLSGVWGESPESLCYLALVLHWKILFGDPTYTGSKVFIFSEAATRGVL